MSEAIVLARAQFAFTLGFHILPPTFSLGILYESFIHPIATLLSLPPASVGALIFLWLFGFGLSVMAVIGLIMLIGTVKKNAIMMIDFAVERLREEHKTAEEAIFEAATLRFRPIMMTTMGAPLGSLPIAIGVGAGSKFTRPLGVAVLGELAVSQVLTLYTIPVTYLHMERSNDWRGRIGRLSRRHSIHAPGCAPTWLESPSHDR